MEVKFIPLSFINESEKIREQIRNTVIFQFVFKEYENPVPLGSLLSNTRYGYTASAIKKGKFKLVRITDIQHGRIDWSGVPFCECNNPEEYLLEEGDILVARTGGTVGKTFLIEEKAKDAVFASYLIRLRSNNKKVLPKYIFYFLNSYSYWSQISDLKSGSAQPNVNAEKLKEILIPYCDLNTQKKIIELIESHKSKDLGDLQNSLNKALSNFENINNLKNLNSDLPKFASSFRRQILQEEFSLSDCKFVKLGEVIRLFKGEQIKDKKLPYLEARYLRGKKEAQIFDNGELAKNGELVILMDGENSGEVFELKENGYLGSTFKILKFEKGIDKKYLQYFLSLHKKRYSGAKKGIAIPHLDKSLFKGTDFPLPPIAEQKRIVEKIDKLMTYCDELEKKIKENQGNSEKLIEAVLKESFQ